MFVSSVPKDYLDSPSVTSKITLVRRKALIEPRKGTIFFVYGGPSDPPKEIVTMYGEWLQNFVGHDWYTKRFGNSLSGSLVGKGL